MKKLIIITLILLSSNCFAEIQLSISKKYKEKIKTALTFNGPEELNKQVSQILAVDLIYSGSFSCPETLTLADNSLSLSTWAKMGAEIVVKGIIKENFDETSITYSLISASTGETILNKVYQGKTSALRNTIHAISEEIIYTLTGEKGISSSSITFTSDKNQNKNIYISDFDGANKKRITLNNSTNLFPAYGPQRKYILFNSYIEGPSYLYSVNKEGAITKVSGFPGLNSLAKANNKHQITLVLSKDGNPEIYTMNSQGKDLKRLTNFGGIDTSPDWSPEGNQIVFVSNRSGNPQLYILNTNNKQTTRLTFEGNYNADPAWAPKGELIAYTSMINNKFQVHTINLNTGEINQITNDNYNNENPSWAPNGNTLVYSSNQKGESQLKIIDLYEKNPYPITSPKKDGNCTNPNWR